MDGFAGRVNARIAKTRQDGRPQPNCDPIATPLHPGLPKKVLFATALFDRQRVGDRAKPTPEFRFPVYEYIRSGCPNLTDESDGSCRLLGSNPLSSPATCGPFAELR